MGGIEDLAHGWREHPAIVEAKLFDPVQQRLAANRETHAGDGAGAALTGLIFDGDGRPMIPTFSYGRGGRCYRYYVAADLQLGKSLTDRRPSDGGASGGVSCAPRRLPAKALEAAMLAHLRRLSNRPHDSWSDLAPMLLRLEVRANDTQLLLKAEVLFSGDHPNLAFEDLERRLEAGERLVWEAGRAGVVRLALPGKLQFRGGRTWRTAGGRLSTVDPELIPALKWAHQILADAGCSPSANPAAWTEATSPVSAYHRKVASLAFLSPALQAAILGGKAPGITLQGLLATDVPLTWADQERMFGLGVSPKSL